jgi:hypothetical protein
MIKRKRVAGEPFIALIALVIKLIGFLKISKDPIDAFLISAFNVLIV